jgi:hypothetical protein
MNNIRCVFKVVPVLQPVAAQQIVRYYPNTPATTFDIVQDTIALIHKYRFEPHIVSFELVKNDYEELPSFVKNKLMKVVDVILMQLDGTIPLTDLSLEVLISKLDELRQAAPK